MPQAKANGMQIEYETFGRQENPPLLLVMGLAMQMLGWEDDFCRQLAGRGFYVVRFDNRDVGLSSKLDHLGVPNVFELMQKAAKGEPAAAPYSLDDLADDAFGLLDALGIGRAHICGASMGGMIVQVMAYRRPERVLSVTSIMSSTGDPKLPPPKPEAMQALLALPPAGREKYLDHAVKTWKVIGSPGYPTADSEIKERMGRMYDRNHHQLGAVRQMAAVIAHGSRRTRLAGVKAPALVIHGEADPLVPAEAGRDTAAAIPGAKLLLLPGMGHDLPRPLWPPVLEAITALARQAAP